VGGGVDLDVRGANRIRVIGSRADLLVLGQAGVQGRRGGGRPLAGTAARPSPITGTTIMILSPRIAIVRLIGLPPSWGPRRLGRKCARTMVVTMREGPEGAPVAAPKGPMNRLKGQKADSRLPSLGLLTVADEPGAADVLHAVAPGAERDLRVKVYGWCSSSYSQTSWHSTGCLAPTPP
jgi:hypothetical protein